MNAFLRVGCLASWPGECDRPRNCQFLVPFVLMSLICIDKGAFDGLSDVILFGRCSAVGCWRLMVAIVLVIGCWRLMVAIIRAIVAASQHGLRQLPVKIARLADQQVDETVMPITLGPKRVCFERDSLSVLMFWGALHRAA